MTVKSVHFPLVKFFATSPRLADAYRMAAKCNKRLGRRASIHELGHAVESGSDSRENHVVVLAHADDDQPAVSAASVEPMASEAFHLLFTEPGTHPGQIAQWMRATKIRSESRLHVVRVENLEAPQVSELLGRVCSAFGPDDGGGSIVDAYPAGDALLVRGPQQRMLHVPLGSIPALKGQSRAVLHHFTLDPDGSFIYWPDLDVHLGWNQFLQAADPAALHKARQRDADFNRRYGAAIRKVREAASIPQAKVEGLTDRQVRRIEQGICRATAGALAALAKAHRLDMNAYMDKLARAM